MSGQWAAVARQKRPTRGSWGSGLEVVKWTHNDLGELFVPPGTEWTGVFWSGLVHERTCLTVVVLHRVSQYLQGWYGRLKSLKMLELQCRFQDLKSA